jgi:hypothetical protein
MTVAAGYRLPVFSGSAFPEFGPGTGFRPLVEPPAKPLEDRLPEEMTAVERALVEARSEFEAVRAADQAEFERRLEERERQALASVADTLSGQLAAGLDRIETAIAQHAARVLAGFLHEAVRERALADLSETVGGLLVGGGAARVKVAGPAALLERLKSIANPGAASIEFTEHDAAEVTVAIDETVVETNIGAWMERVDSATRGEANG